MGASSVVRKEEHDNLITILIIVLVILVITALFIAVVSRSFIARRMVFDDITGYKGDKMVLI